MCAKEKTRCLADNAVAVSDSRQQHPLSRPTDLKRPNELECQVPGCTNDIVGCKDIHVRCRVCDMHFRAPVSLILGVEQRFCQLCGKFHMLSEFDGLKVSCREKLMLHNKRRRDNRTKRRLAKDASRTVSKELGTPSQNSLDSTAIPMDEPRRLTGSHLKQPSRATHNWPVDSLDALPAKRFGACARRTAPACLRQDSLPDNRELHTDSSSSGKRHQRFDLDSGPFSWDREIRSCPSQPNGKQRFLDSRWGYTNSEYGVNSTDSDLLFFDDSCGGSSDVSASSFKWHEAQPSISFEWDLCKTSQANKHNGVPFHMLDAESLLDTAAPQGYTELPWWKITDLL